MMKITIPPPLTETTTGSIIWHDFRLILGTQLRVTKIKSGTGLSATGFLAFGLVVTSILFLWALLISTGQYGTHKPVGF